MLEYDVHAASDFEADLDEAVAYRIAEVGPQSAARLVAEYEKAVRRLRVVPDCGSRIGTTEYRWCPIGSFVAVYRKDEEQRHVVLLRLVWMSSNWKARILGGTLPVE